MMLFGQIVTVAYGRRRALNLSIGGAHKQESAREGTVRAWTALLIGRGRPRAVAQVSDSG